MRRFGRADVPLLLVGPALAAAAVLVRRTSVLGVLAALMLAALLFVLDLVVALVAAVAHCGLDLG